RGRAEHESVGGPAEALAVLGETDRLVRRAQDAVAGLLDVPGESERRLPAELGHDADGLLAVADGEHLLRRERLEIEPVRGVVVGGDRLRVAVHHHGLVPERAEGLGRVHAAVVELDPLADAIRSRAEDDDTRLPSGGWSLVLLAPRRVVVVGGGLDLSRPRVNAAERMAEALLMAEAAHLGT